MDGLDAAAGKRDEPVVDADGRRVVDADVEEGDPGADVGEEAICKRSRVDLWSVIFTIFSFQRWRQVRESTEVRTASRRSRRTRISSRSSAGREESRSSAAAARFGSITPPVPDSLSARQRLQAEAAAGDGSLSTRSPPPCVRRRLQQSSLLMAHFSMGGNNRSWEARDQPIRIWPTSPEQSQRFRS